MVPLMTAADGGAELGPELAVGADVEGGGGFAADGLLFEHAAALATTTTAKIIMRRRAAVTSACPELRARMRKSFDVERESCGIEQSSPTSTPVQWGLRLRLSPVRIATRRWQFDPTAYCMSSEET